MDFWKEEHHTNGNHLESLLSEILLWHPVRFLWFPLRGLRGSRRGTCIYEPLLSAVLHDRHFTYGTYDSSLQPGISLD